MANTTPDNIVYPDATMRVGAIRSALAALAASVQAAITAVRNELTGAVDDVYALPDPQISTGGGVQAIGSGGWTAIPNLGAITIDLARPAWVQVNLGAWVVATVGELRAGVALSGSTVQDAQSPNWGSTIYSAGLTTTGMNASKTVLCGAGSTTFTPVAQQTGGGVKQFNYSTFEVIPLRWDTPPA